MISLIFFSEVKSHYPAIIQGVDGKIHISNKLFRIVDYVVKIYHQNEF